MSFNPKTKYKTSSENFEIKDFFEYKADYVTRPPYQRKSVWSTKKKQSLMDSLIRRYYIPRLVIREVRLAGDRTINEVIDGQQRITAVQEFFGNKYPLLKDLGEVDERLAGSLYKNLPPEIQKFIGKKLKFQVDIIEGIGDPESDEHRIIATEIFKRLQEGDSLNYMEKAHAQLSSPTRNFIVKYSDDQTFDYEKYEAVEDNPKRHKFFSLLNVDNKRMKHSQLMTRFVMIEYGDGYAELNDKKFVDFIHKKRPKGPIGDTSFEKEPKAQATLKTLDIFYDIFKNDKIRDEESGVIKELSKEYFIISVYLLIRYLNKYYVIDADMKIVIYKFIRNFYDRWSKVDKSKITDDTNLLTFSHNRQQGERELEERDSIIRYMFFEYLSKKGKKIIVKDTKRAFSELERIKIYRDGKGLCKLCLKEGKPEKEAEVSWSNYQADHIIPHSKGGQTDLDNAQLLCRPCNQSKSNKLS